MSNPGAASTQSTVVGFGLGDPAVLGSSATSLISFYGGAGIAKQTKAVAVATTGSSSTTNAYGFTTAAQADAIPVAINAIITIMTNLSLTT